MNSLIINNFSKLISLLRIENDNLNYKTNNKQITINNFKIKSLKNVIKIISKLDFTIKSSEQVKNIPGVGKGSILRINEIIEKGSLAELVNYEKRVQKTKKRTKIINDLMNIIGIGKVMAMTLVDKYKIKSVNELKELAKTNHKIINDKIKLGLKYLGKFEGNIPKKDIDNIYDYLQNITHKFNKNMFITICGSYRRELQTSSDIDILLINTDLITGDDINKYNIDLNNSLLAIYIKYLHTKNILIDDITDKNIKTKYMGFGKFNNKIRRVDVRLMPLISYWYALLYFTGSYELNQIMRSRAKKLGYKLNEYGLYDLKTDEMIIVTSEQEIFEKLEMNYIEPNKR